MRILLALTLLAGALAAPVGAQQIGSKPPEFVAQRWYNSPPLLLGDLTGKAVQIEVFRTW